MIKPSDFDVFKSTHGYHVDCAFALASLFDERVGTYPPVEFHRLCEHRPQLLRQWLDSMLPFQFVGGGSAGLAADMSVRDRLRSVARPESFADPAVWLLFACVETTSYQFAKTFSEPTKHEPTLTAHLFGMMAGAADHWIRAGHTALESRGSSLTLKQLELQTRGRETATGGDTALFIEQKVGLGSEVIPVILQSKRYKRERVRIHHVTKRDGLEIVQYKTLVGHSLPAAYLLFQNSPTRIPNALPPLVKSVKNIPQIGDAAPRSTLATVGSTTLGAYILETIASAPETSRFPSAQEAIDALLREVSVEELTNVVVASTVEAAEPRFRDALSYALNKDDPAPGW